MMRTSGETNPLEEKLKYEILTSERIRLKILGAVSLIPFVLILLAFIFIPKDAAGGNKNFLPILIADFVILLFAIREFLIANVLKKRIEKRQPIKLSAQYINTFLEVSMPSVIIIIVTFYWESVVVLSTPLMFLYVIIIMLTTLSLNQKLSIFAGSVAAIQFALILIFLLNEFKYPDELSVLNGYELHFGKVVLLFLSGIISGFVADQLRSRMFRTVEIYEERNRIVELFGQQVSQQIVDELISQRDELESKRKFVCVMFLDIRGFTGFAELKEPEEIIKYQNDIFGFMIEIINDHGGIINQFLGDGYMATFGAPISKGNDTLNAVKAAQKIVNDVNAKSNSGAINSTRIGIGLHSGYVVAGNVGTKTRKQYSVSGSTVILASRIEQLNKKFNSQILISEEVLNEIGRDEVEFQNLGEVEIKGREKPMNIYKLA